MGAYGGAGGYGNGNGSRRAYGERDVIEMLGVVLPDPIPGSMASGFCERYLFDKLTPLQVGELVKERTPGGRDVVLRARIDRRKTLAEKQAFLAAAIDARIIAKKKGSVYRLTPKGGQAITRDRDEARKAAARRTPLPMERILDIIDGNDADERRYRKQRRKDYMEHLRGAREVSGSLSTDPLDIPTRREDEGF